MKKLTLFIYEIYFSNLIILGNATNSDPFPIYMDEMFNLGRKVYDKQAMPTQSKGIPTYVNFSMYIEGLSSFRTRTMDFQLDVYFQQSWKDTRLSHNESQRILIRDQSILDKIWHPDVYFANARIAKFHNVTQPNFLLWIYPDGSIFYDTRISMIVMCMMNLAKWPLDEQRCNLRILSYAYVIEEVEISWNENEPITRNPNIAMSDMHIIDLSPGLCDGNYSTGVWSCVTAEFYVKREITHHVMQSYVPTTLIVVISWFSFWLDVEAVVARVSLAITTLLTLSTQSNAARLALPEVSYMKAIDVWMGACMMFVFGVMIEFTIVNYAQRQKSEKKEETEDEKKEKEKDKASYRNLLKHARVWLVQKFHIGNKNLQLKEQDDKEKNNISTYCKNEGDSTISATGTASYGSFAKRQRIITLENGSPKINGTPIKRDENRKKRESERLANWMKSENSCFINSDQNSNILQARKKISDVSSSTSDQPGGKPIRRFKEQLPSILKRIAKKKNDGINQAKKIDQRSRWAFPLSFLFFNFLYWTYYLCIA